MSRHLLNIIKEYINIVVIHRWAVMPKVNNIFLNELIMFRSTAYSKYTLFKIYFKFLFAKYIHFRVHLSNLLWKIWNSRKKNLEEIHLKNLEFHFYPIFKAVDFTFNDDNTARKHECSLLRSPPNPIFYQSLPFFSLKF